LRHLDLLIDKMNQKSSLIQILKSVPRVLTSDTQKIGHSPQFVGSGVPLQYPSRKR
ncbi:hypothetical protein SAMN04488512_14110, partial [Sulfitobacter litoralis]